MFMKFVFKQNNNNIKLKKWKMNFSGAIDIKMQFLRLFANLIGLNLFSYKNSPPYQKLF